MNTSSNCTLTERHLPTIHDLLAHRSLPHAFAQTPLARVYQIVRGKDETGKAYRGPIVEGIDAAEATPYARKFQILGLAGLQQIATTGDEPAWLAPRYKEAFGVEPPP